MLYKKEYLTMSDGATVTFHSWLPEEVRLIVVLSHGMAEHAKRYARFADSLALEGIGLYAEDHRGHGETAERSIAEGTGSFGFLAKKDGFFRVVEDIREEVALVKARHPYAKVMLFGHSFGSFVAQCFIERYGSSVDGCILCGTAGPRPLTVAAGYALANLVNVFTKSQKPSALLNAICFGSYNAHISPKRTAVDWLSRDKAEVDTYIADPLCGFTCSAGFFKDLLAGLRFIHKRSSLYAIPRNIPVLFIEGTSDPVGSYGKTVRALHNIYTKRLHLESVELKMYEGARHELLNETNRAQVTQDVIAWLNHQVTPSC